MADVRGLGRATFAAVLLMIGGVLNVIWGIAAIGNSRFLTSHGHYVFSNLHTWGWTTLILGVLEVGASLSLLRGNAYGRLFGIIAGALVAIDALLDIPAQPFWSICVFALSLWIIHGLVLYGEDMPATS